MYLKTINLLLLLCYCHVSMGQALKEFQGPYLQGDANYTYYVDEEGKEIMEGKFYYRQKRKTASRFKVGTDESLHRQKSRHKQSKKKKKGRNNIFFIVFLQTSSYLYGEILFYAHYKKAGHIHSQEFHDPVCRYILHQSFRRHDAVSMEICR